MMILKSVIALKLFVIVNALSIALDTEVDAIPLNNTISTLVRAPWHVSIRVNGVHVCSGAIIYSDWVITSAQCVFTCESMKPIVTITTTSGSIHRFYSYAIYDSYKLNDGCHLPQNDIGLIRIADSFNLNGQNSLEIIKIHSLNNIPTEDTILNVTHWNQQLADDKFSDTLKMSQWSTLSDQQCFSFYYSMTGNGLNRFCAANSDNHNNVANPCAIGDLGDPMVLNGKLIGIKSWKLNCTIQPQSPTIFTRVKPYFTWIKSKVGDITLG